MDNKKVTVPLVVEKKLKGEKIVMVTAYDFWSAQVVDSAEVDIVLVGDSVGMVFSGYKNTLPVTLEEIIYHTKAVSRGVKNALIVADMPYGSFHLSIEESCKNCIKIIKETGAQAVKVEGARVDLIKSLIDIEIPVMGHLGLTPQSIHKLGGYKVQGKSEQEKEYIYKSAKKIEEAGAFSLVLECVPEDLAKDITQELNIPTIGIGAGKYCDGQVLVFHDILGCFEWAPKFVKKYTNLRKVAIEAIKNFSKEVKAGVFHE